MAERFSVIFERREVESRVTVEHGPAGGVMLTIVDGKVAPMSPGWCNQALLTDAQARDVAAEMARSFAVGQRVPEKAGAEAQKVAAVVSAARRLVGMDLGDRLLRAMPHAMAVALGDLRAALDDFGR